MLIQFQDPLTTAENLLSFLNGEGIDIAFATVSWDDPFVSVPVSIFNKIYLFLFIFIFIYIVLSLFIGIFNQAYDSLSVSEYNYYLKLITVEMPYVMCAVVTEYLVILEFK